MSGVCAGRGFVRRSAVIGAWTVENPFERLIPQITFKDFAEMASGEGVDKGDVPRNLEAGKLVPTEPEQIIGKGFI